MKLIVTLPYCQKDHESATRLLNWIKELDGHVDHALLLVADNAVPVETKLAIDKLGKSVFTYAETILVNAPAPLADNYHPCAAHMFLKTMAHVEQCYRWPFLWMEPDCVPLKHGWLDALAQAYEESPKDYMGSAINVKQDGVPNQVFFATAVYPNDAHEHLKQYCDGKQAFDMAFSPYVWPRGINTPLMFHCFGAPNDPPTFKAVKELGDGPNVGTLDSIPKQAVLMHRCKDGSLISLIQETKNGFFKPVPTLVLPDSTLPTQEDWTAKEVLPPDVHTSTQTEPPKRGPGRPRKHPLESVTP